MIKKMFLCLCFLNTLSACVKISDAEQEAPPSAAAPSPASVFPLEGPNQYQVELPIISEAQIFRRERIDSTDLKVETLPMLVRGSSLVDTTPVAGARYRYSIGVMNQGQFQSLATFEVLIPQDLVIESSLALSENTRWHQYRRIFILSGSVITTNGFQLSIKADHLNSEGATVLTFPENSTAPSGVAGRNGGMIALDLFSAEGDLNVLMRGEDGGQGANGEPFAGPPQPPYPCYNHSDYNPNGARGRRGQNGSRGGNSGSLLVKIENKNLLNINLIKNVGVGGPGGAGGAGQPGGTKGISSFVNGASRCSIVETGTAGEYGESGETGPQGMYERFCLKDPSGERCD